MLIPLLLLSIPGLVLAEGGRTAEDCTIGEQWTEKYIRFECYQGTGTVVKGVRPIGCVPNNTDSESMIEPGKTYDEQFFTYSCSKKDDVVSYQIINCRDSTGKALAVDETRTMADGTTWKCYKDSSDEIKLSQDTAGGCVVEGTKYVAGQTWTQTLEFTATVGGAKKVIGKAVRMECKRVGAAYVASAYGCVTASGVNLNNGSFATDNSINVKCVVKADGTVSLIVVEEKDVTCSFDGTTVKNKEKYTTKDGQNVYTCIYGVIKKLSCIINGKTYAADTFYYVAGKGYFCSVGAGYVDFGSTTGCKLPDGTVKQFYGVYINATEVHRCYFRINGTVVTTFTAFYGCLYNGKAVGKYQIASKDGKELKKCGLANGSYSMRDLTEAELAAYLASKSKADASKTYSGVGGSGTGEDFTALPTLPNLEPGKGVSAPSQSATQSPEEKPLPEIPENPGKCEDFFTKCSDLAPICQKPGDLSTVDLTEIIKKSDVCAEKIKEVFKSLGFENPETACTQNQLFKRRVHEIVKVVCPNTCGACNEASKTPAIIKDLVDFYATKDCK